MTPLEIALLALAGINLVAFGAMGLDKWKSIKGWRRIPERTLYLFAFLGGALGIFLGSRAFRHKTVKSSFRWRYWLATFGALLWIGGAVWFFWLRDG